VRAPWPAGSLRFWSAYKNTKSLTYAKAIELGLEASTFNVPHLKGCTLIMIDASGSMGGEVSGKSQMSCGEVAAVFSASVARKNNSFLAAYDYARNITGFQIGQSTLRLIENIRSVRKGGGTETWQSTQAMWNTQGPFDRVMIFTDMQDHPSNGNSFIPKEIPVYVWDCAGYKTANLELGSNRYLLAGLNDQMFKLVELLENFKTGQWPWEI